MMLCYVLRCYKYDMNTFDPFLNMKHFHECILKIVKILLDDSNESTDEKLCSEMVSLLIIANLGNYKVLHQVLPSISMKLVDLYYIKYIGIIR